MTDTSSILQDRISGTDNSILLLENQTTSRRPSLTQKRICSNNLGSSDAVASSNLHVEALNIQQSRCQGEDSNAKEALELTEYINTLKAEKSKWKITLHDRRKQCKETQRHLQEEPLVLSVETCAEFLSEEDMKFLNEIPNYKKILNDIDRVVETSAICMVIKANTDTSLSKLTQISEQHLNVIKDHILDRE